MLKLSICQFYLILYAHLKKTGRIMGTHAADGRRPEHLSAK